MTLNQVMQKLEEYGSETTKTIFSRHGAREPFFGVKVGDLKKILKQTKNDHELALQLYTTGNSDAMYLAALMADPARMTRGELNTWVKKAYWYMLSEYAVAGVAAESPHGLDLAREWIASKAEMTAAAGWATYSGLLALRDNAELDLEEIAALCKQIQSSIHTAQNRVRYTMNNFIISTGAYIPALQDQAVKIAEAIGKVKVDMGQTECKVPYAPDYIKKVADRGSTGKKRKRVRC